MQHLTKRLILSLAALLVVCGVSLSAGTALAEHGSNSGSGGGGSDSSNDTAEVATSSTTDTNNEQETEHSKTLRDQLVELITQLHGASTSTDKTKDSSTNSTTE
jgi:hypothetical protein